MLMGDTQCCRFSRNIAQVTPKIIYFYYQKKMFVGSKYPKNTLINVEKNFTGDTACLDKFDRSDAKTIAGLQRIRVLKELATLAAR